MASPPISDTAIIFLLQQQNNRQGWECLYDKYAAILYGNILRATSDKTAAQKILSESFISLQHTNLATQTKQTMLSFLLHHTYRICKQNLSESEINSLEEKLYSAEQPLLNLLLFTPHTMQQITGKTGLNEAGIKRKLQSESNEIIRKNNTEKKYQVGNV